MFANLSFDHELVRSPRAQQLSGAFGTLCCGEDLSAEEAQGLFGELVSGELPDIKIAALLIALKVKGETTAEMIGAARALRAASLYFDRPSYLFADSCGTGGDSSGSINISTAVAFVAAAAGLPIAKHGNRSFTSRCGSADVLEVLGAKLDITPAQARRVLDDTGVCFLFAPLYHPGLKHAGPARQALKVRTIMNVLGPCLNPAAPPVQLLGVADPTLLEPVAHTLVALGVDTALVVHGSGLDEIALHRETVAIRITHGAIEPLVLMPEDAGLERASLDAIRGGDPLTNARRLTRILDGKGEDAEADLVALNAGALLMTAGLAGGLREGVQRALDAIRSGEAARRLRDFIEASNA